MNARRIHKLMRKRFPPVLHVERDWTLVQDERGTRVRAIADLIAAHIMSAEAVVEVNRKVGALLPLADVPAYIAAHIGQGEIRVADRAFTGYVVVAQNGVAAGWRTAANPSFQATASGAA